MLRIRFIFNIESLSHLIFKLYYRILLFKINKTKDFPRGIPLFSRTVRYSLPSYGSFPLSFLNLALGPMKTPSLSYGE